MMSLSLGTILAAVGASLRRLGGRAAILIKEKTSRTALLVGAGYVRRFVKRFMADGSSAAVIEYALIMVLVGLACITAWMHVSASLSIPSALANTTASVETSGSVRSRWLHRALRTQRLRRSEKRLYGAGCPAQVRIGSIAPIEAWSALSRSCAAFPPRRSLSLQ